MGKLASRQKANSYRNTSILLSLVGIVLLLAGFATTIFLSVLSAIPFIIAANLWNKQKTWEVGAKGEESTIRVLRNLDPSYKIVHDVFLPGDTQNIDHVVIGPTGTFVIETKNHNGIVRCNGDYWSRKKVGRRGTVYSSSIGNPSKQVKRNALVLKKWLESKSIDVGYINAVVVFTNDDLKLKLENLQ